MRTVDIHTHIIPNVDDGADTLKEALSMLKKAAACGTTEIVATPHRLRGHHDYISPKELYSQYKDFRAAAAAVSDVKIYFGAEMHFSDEAEFPANREFITLNGTRNVLTEFPFFCSFEFAKETLERIRSLGLTPIIAHPERYSFVINRPTCFEDLLLDGTVAQLDADSIYGYSGRFAPTAEYLLSCGLIYAVASDCHSNISRTPDMTDAYTYVSELLSRSQAEALFVTNPSSLIHQ